jgi:hypothetical protein
VAEQARFISKHVGHRQATTEEMLEAGFEMLETQRIGHYSPAGNDGVLEIGVHQNIILSSAIIPDIQDSNHPQTLLQIPDHFKLRIFRNQLKFTDCGEDSKPCILE